MKNLSKILFAALILTACAKQQLPEANYDIVSTDVACNVSISGMNTGVYVLRLINGNNVRTQKIVME